MPWGHESIGLPRLQDLLAQRRGMTNAITARDLTVILGLREQDGRSIREAVNALIDAGCPIGSTTREPYGYFWITTEAELELCLRNYRARAHELDRRMERLVEAFRHGLKQEVKHLEAQPSLEWGP